MLRAMPDSKSWWGSQLRNQISERPFIYDLDGRDLSLCGVMQLHLAHVPPILIVGCIWVSRGSPVVSARRHWEAGSEKGGSVYCHVKPAPATIVRCMLGARVGSTEANSKLLAPSHQKFIKVITPIGARIFLNRFLDQFQNYWWCLSFQIVLTDVMKSLFWVTLLFI